MTGLSVVTQAQTTAHSLPRHDLGHWAPSIVPSVPSGSPHTVARWAQPPELLWGGRLARLSPASAT